jgi:Tol biopolymer transport system component
MKVYRLCISLCLTGVLAACGQAGGELTPSPEASPSPASAAWLAYLWPAEGAADLYALDPLSGEVLRLTESASVLDYSLSPDGFFIYYSAANAQGGSDLYRLDLLHGSVLPGSNQPLEPEVVLKCMDACRNPQRSPDGRWVAYERLEAAPTGGLVGVQVWLLDPVTVELRLAGDPTHHSQNPQWSSTGLLAFFDLDAKAYLIYNPDTQQSVRLSNQTGEPGCWLADGSAYIASEIFYVNLPGSEPVGSSHLLRYPPDGGGSTDLTLADDLEDTAVACSADDLRLAFARKYLDPNRWTPGRQLWLMDSDGGQARALTDEPMYNHYDFAWSPDGRWLAYLRFNQAALTAPPELWMINADGSGPLQLVIGGYAPQWIP